MCRGKSHAVELGFSHCSLVQCLLKQAAKCYQVTYGKPNVGMFWIISLQLFSDIDLPSLLRVTFNIKQECKACTLLPPNCIKRWNITILKCLPELKCGVKVYPTDSYNVPYQKSTLCTSNFFLSHSGFAFRDSTKMQMQAAYLKIKAHQNTAFRTILF